MKRRMSDKAACTTFPHLKYIGSCGSISALNTQQLLKEIKAIPLQCARQRILRQRGEKGNHYAIFLEEEDEQ